VRPDQRRTVVRWCDRADAALAAPGLGPGVELLTAVVRHYQQITGRQLSADRIMARHLRQAPGDVLWRSDAGLPLADPPDTAGVVRGPGRRPQRTWSQPRSATRS
jgi:hypothetical protein